jgi:hypothetical protein
MAEPTPVERNTERARLTWLAMRRLHDRSTQLYQEPPIVRFRVLEALLGKRAATAALWPYANAWAATRAMATLSSMHAPPGGGSWPELLEGHLRGLVAYGPPDNGVSAPGDIGPLRLQATTWHPPGGGSDAYYDDNAWVALDLLGQHSLTGEADCLALAGRVLDFVLSGWNEEPTWAHPGGIRWAEPAWSRCRNTCVNGPAAEAALLLHARTGGEGRLQWAKRLVEWVDGALRAPSGLYHDRIDPDGTVHEELWTYNQGTLIGAKVLLYEATGEASHLAEAREIAASSASWLSSGDTLAGQPAPFLAIYLRNLLLLGRHADVSPGVEQLARFAGWYWEQRRDARSGLFPAGKAELNATAGMAAIYALLAGAEPAA